MKKGEKLRGSVLTKGIAFLLALASAVAFCIGAGGLLLCLARTGGAGGSYDPVSYSGFFYDQVEEVQDLLFLSLYQDGLTQVGEYQLERLSAELDGKNTNFRYRITDDTGHEVLTNLGREDKTEPEGNYVQNTWERYPLGCNRMISYYLDLDKISEWKLEYGTPSQWTNTPYASVYYYDAYAIFNQADVWEDNDITQTEEASNNGRTDYEVVDEAYDGTDMAAAESAPEPEQDTGEQFYYFVYHGSLESYNCTAWVDTTYPVQDQYAEEYQQFLSGQTFVDRWIGPASVLTGVSLLLFLGMLAVLTWSCGWNSAGELALRGLNRMPLELVLILSGGGAFVACLLVGNAGGGELRWNLVCFALAGLIGAATCLPGWYILAAQIKNRALLERSICGRTLCWVRRKWGSLRSRVRAAVGQWPLYRKVVVAFAGYAVPYLFWHCTVTPDALYSWSWPMAAILVLLPILPLAVFACKWAADWAKLRRAVKEMTAGKLDCAIDTTHMLPDLKEHATDLSNLSEGIGKAVEEQVKSQRFKTELITNVSHDLKTPLTSIINYVDLLKKSDIQDETVRGYIDVLDRKSQRLKTLTEDLVEASKAASGTIAVQLERLDLSQLVNQAAAEYEERLEQAGLTPVISAPKQACTVMADGRHLWRILDNLLGNCTKYAMPGTRVYLDVTEGEGSYTVTVKNISADPLNVPADELMKRFVRGDSARSTEGSGLGLSIARNLTTAQKGSFELVVDGDLFKARVTLPKGAPQPEKEPQQLKRENPTALFGMDSPAAPAVPTAEETPAPDPLADFLDEIG